MNILLCFLFFFIVLSSAAPIRDINGDELKPGVEYYMRLATPLHQPITLGTFGKEHCPAEVIIVPNNLIQRVDLPVTLHPINKDVRVITESTDVNIRTEGVDFCPEYSPVWQLNFDNDKTTISGGGEIGTLAGSGFIIKNDPRFRNAYNLFYCPFTGMACSFATNSITPNVVLKGFWEDGAEPITFYFVKKVNSV